MTRFHVHIRLHNGENTIDFEGAKRTLGRLFISMYLSSPKARLDISKTESYSFAEDGCVINLNCLAMIITGMELTVMESFVARCSGVLKIPDNNVSVFCDKHELTLL